MKAIFRVLGVWGLLGLPLLPACGEGGNEDEGSAAAGGGATKKVVGSCSAPSNSVCVAWFGDGYSYDDVEAGCSGEDATASTNDCAADRAIARCTLPAGPGKERAETYYQGYPEGIFPLLIEGCTNVGGTWIEY